MIVDILRIQGEATRGDYNSRPSAEIRAKLEMADQFRECSAI